MRERDTSFPKSKMKVLLLEGIHHEAQQAFENEGFPVESLPSSLAEQELQERISEIYILGIRSRTKLNPSAISEAAKLLVVGAFCIGTDQIDLPSANEKGIAIFNDEFSSTRSVAELALAEAAILLRNIPEKNAQMHNGLWVKSTEHARVLRGKTLCLIGYGKIASQESILAESWGMQVVFYDIAEVLALGNAKRMDSMEDALKVADVVSIHVDGRDENINLIGASQFEIMKDGAVYIDSSRGFVTDTQALAQYLKNGKLKGAAIDVHDNEPKGNNAAFESPLRDLNNVILSPHVGGSTLEAQEDIAQFVSDKLLSFINAGDTTLSVNFPNIQLPDQTDAHRFLHLHRNVPGVLAAINEVLADSGLNVLGQYLQTADDLGYVITDVNRQYDEDILDQLKEIPETVKFRVLY